MDTGKREIPASNAIQCRALALRQSRNEILAHSGCSPSSSSTATGRAATDQSPLSRATARAARPERMARAMSTLLTILPTRAPLPDRRQLLAEVSLDALHKL